MTEEKILIALAGNPNSGKSSLFNAMTGAHQHVGNYPGVTIEKKEGESRYEHHRFRIVDLPGIYSMTSYSQEEVIARRFIVEDRPSVVVNVIDASNLERNLYLTIQLLEMGANVVVALNMMDEVKRSGVALDTETISKRLGCPVIETVAHKGVGIKKLYEAILEVHARGKSDTEIIYLDELGKEIEKISAKMQHLDKIPYLPTFAAIKLLESDIEVMARFRRLPDTEALFRQVELSRKRLSGLYGYPPEVLIGDRRYGFASGLVKEVTIRKATVDRISMTEKIDSVVTNRLIGLPLFLGVMYLIFWLTFTLGAPPMEWIDSGFSMLGKFVNSNWPTGRFLLLKSLIVDGIIGGVGGVIIFLPNIILLFMGISFLEETGYMARIAFIVDRIMHKIGLHGRSFIPLLIGFGCTVPAIMATRTIKSRQTRMTTIMILPLMSCGARLPIYLMIIPAFFPSEWQTPMLWTMYLIGIALAFIISRFLRKVIFTGEAEPFVMELPPYRLPTMKSVMIHMWQKSWLYLKKAGTVILGISMLMWVLLTFPQKPHFDIDSQANRTGLTSMQLEEIHRQEALDYSFAGRIGRFAEPVLKPMGFDWKIGTSFIGAFAAKEVFVATMGVVYAIGDVDQHTDSLRRILKRKYDPLIGFCIMLFALIATPCSATLAIARKEMNSWFWAVMQWVGLTTLGYIVTTIVYQVGRRVLY